MSLSAITLIWKLLEWNKISQVLAMIFYGIITEIALKNHRFIYAPNSELYMNQR